MPALIAIDAARFGAALAAWGQTIDRGDAATVRYQVALSRLPWAHRHRRLVALADEHGTVLAAAARHELRGRLEGAPVRVCVISEIAAAGEPATGHAAHLIDGLVQEATTQGFDVVVVLGTLPRGTARRFASVDTTLLTLRVNESPRRGAPMAPVRSGERRDMALIAAIPPWGRERRGLQLERDDEYVDFLTTRRRVHAGLAPEGLRQVAFLVVEEGMRPAAYLMMTISGQDWVVEYCGDHDPAGARVGAILQTLIAREPAERRPAITAWFPDDIVPPQVTVLSSETVPDRVWICPLAASAWSSAPGVSLWRGDLP